MTVTVRAFGVFSSILGNSKLVLPFAGNTVGDLINKLATQCGEKVREELLDEEGNLDYSYILLTEGERLSGLSAKIEDGDEIVIATMLGGG